jgi:hypothetical protein
LIIKIDFLYGGGRVFFLPFSFFFGQEWLFTEVLFSQTPQSLTFPPPRLPAVSFETVASVSKALALNGTKGIKVELPKPRAACRLAPRSA